MWRPLLKLEKSAILGSAHMFGVPYFKDSTPRWMQRGMIREDLLPTLLSVYGTGPSACTLTPPVCVAGCFCFCLFVYLYSSCLALLPASLPLLATACSPTITACSSPTTACSSATTACFSTRPPPLRLHPRACAWLSVCCQPHFWYRTVRMSGFVWCRTINM